MKKTSKIIIGLTVVAIAGAGIAAGVAAYTSSKIKSGPAIIPEGFTVTAHTGCEGTRENSLEAIEKGAATADIVEFDLSFTQGGEPVLAHDKAEADSVTLEEAFNTVARYEGLRVNVDCKATDNLKAVTETAEKCGVLDRIFYTGIEEKDVDAVKAQTPQVAYYLNFDVKKSKKNDEEYIRSLVQKVKDTGAVGLNINFKGASKKMVDIFHSEGLEVSVWTVSKELQMHKVLAMGCDNITTREPSLLKKVIDSKA